MRALVAHAIGPVASQAPPREFVRQVRKVTERDAGPAKGLRTRTPLPRLLAGLVSGSCILPTPGPP
ncbi:MAG: hypothetical protein ACRDV8_03380 [Acidimicrobiales bacterium]